MPPDEHISRRNLPHWYVPGALHFLTWRLAGTIPNPVLHDLRQRREDRLRRAPDNPAARHKEHTHKEFFAAYDQYLDAHRDLDWLARPPLAALVRGNLYHHHGGKYHLLAYCVMPNHVHALLQPTDPQARTPAFASDEVADAGSPLASVMHSLKSYTAHKAAEILGRTGQFWQHESYDHWVRDVAEAERIIRYIVWNPVKAGLAAAPHLWFFSSAHDRFLHDGSDEGYVNWDAVIPPPA